MRRGRTLEPGRIRAGTDPNDAPLLKAFSRAPGVGQSRCAGLPSGQDYTLNAPAPFPEANSVEVHTARVRGEMEFHDRTQRATPRFIACASRITTARDWFSLDARVCYHRAALLWVSIRRFAGNNFQRSTTWRVSLVFQ